MRTEIKMPCDLEAERELLTAVFIDNDVYYSFSSFLSPDDFYKKSHMLIYHAMQSLFEKLIPVDMVTVVSRLQLDHTLEAVGGAAYISGFLNQIPLAINAWAYAEIIKKKSILRQLIIAGDNLQKQSLRFDADPKKIIDNLEFNIKNISHSKNERYAVMTNIVNRTTEKIEQVATAEYQEPIYTGLIDIDRIVAGIKGSKLIFIAARPAIGKTSLMLTMARNMAIAGVKIGIMSLEMEEIELDTCWLAMESGINSLRLRAPKELDKSDWVKIVKANEKRCQWPIIVDDSGGATIASVNRTARKMVADGCRIIFIDQLSKISGTRLKSKFEETTEVVESLGTLKKELRIPIVVLAQINRQGGAENVKPKLYHLKNTGQIEEEADIVFILHREEVLNPLPENKGLANIEIAKQRSGPIGNVTIGWNAKLTQFHNLEWRAAQYISDKEEEIFIKDEEIQRLRESWKEKGEKNIGRFTTKGKIITDSIFQKEGQ